MVLNMLRIRGTVCIVLIGLFTGLGCGDGTSATKSAPEPNVGPAGPPSAPAAGGTTPAKTPA